MTGALAAWGGGALLPLAAGAVLLAGLGTALAWAPMRRDNRLRRALDHVRDAYAPAGAAPPAKGLAALAMRLAGPVGGLLTRSGLLSAKTLATLETTLAVAGLRGSGALPAFVGAKALLLVLLTLAAWGISHRLGVTGLWARLLPACGAVFGLLLPDLVLGLVRKRYVSAVERAMPDALDLLVICAEAGLALEQGMERVAREIAPASGPCAIELRITHDELRIFSDRRTALMNLGRRTGLVSLQRLAGTLAQALQYGTPLSQALRSLATELRGDALARFEARAARLPVLMTLPMILFILPCVFLVVAGPAMLAVYQTMHSR